METNNNKTVEELLEQEATMQDKEEIKTLEPELDEWEQLEKDYTWKDSLETPDNIETVEININGD